jgi:hypothetical protein
LNGDELEWSLNGKTTKSNVKVITTEMELTSKGKTRQRSGDSGAVCTAERTNDRQVLMIWPKQQAPNTECLSRESRRGGIRAHQVWMRFVERGFPQPKK